MQKAKAFSISIPKKERKRLLPNVTELDYLDNSEVDTLNARLSNIKELLKKIEHEFKIQQIRFNAEMVISELKECITAAKDDKLKKVEAKGLIYDYIDKYVIDHKDIKQEGSLKIYKTLKRYLSEFEAVSGEKLSFADLDHNFFGRFQKYLLSLRKPDGLFRLNNNTVGKLLKTVKTFIGYAKKEGITINAGYKDFKISNDKTEVIALTQNEFEAIQALTLPIGSRLDKVRDLFVFSCATGLRYSDLSQLRWEHIKSDAIELRITKTRELHSVPLNAISVSILNKYEGVIKPLPIISSQKLNVYIKELCSLAGINELIEISRLHGAKKTVKVYPKFELIHIHTGRKTFCTLSLEKGMSAEEVMEISGHSDYRSFKRYIKVTEQRKKTVMLKAWGGFEQKLKFV